MNNFKKLLVSATLLVGTSAANAAVVCNGTTQCQGPATEIMASLFPSPTGGILISSPAVVSGLPCSGASGGNNIILPASHANYNQTYATLLTASVSGNEVILRIDTAQQACTLFFARMIN